MKSNLFKITTYFVLTFILSAFSQSQTGDSLTLDLAIQQVLNNHPLVEQQGFEHTGLRGNFVYHAINSR